MSYALVPTPNPCFNVRSVDRIIDGDTAIVTVDKWHGLLWETRVRLLEVDTPERDEPDPWKAAAVFTGDWLYRSMESHTLYVEGSRFDSFGRLLGYFWDGTTAEGLNGLLVANKLGKAVPLHIHLKELGAID